MQKSLYAFLLILIVACNDGPKGPEVNPNTPDAPKMISYSVVNTYPHDTSYFTEGLLFYKGELYESTGEKGKSWIVKTDLKTGKALQKFTLDEKYFGEGIVIINDTVYQLTYQDEIGFMYSLKDFKKIGEFKFASKEGWGMTTDGTNIIASDGTSNLYYYEPATFKFLRTQSVTEAGTPIGNINELEYIDGYIYANQWISSYILKIDPADGKVVGKIDFSQITNSIKTKYSNAEVMNGIAYDSATQKMYVTGKRWPEMYEIQLSR